MNIQVKTKSDFLFQVLPFYEGETNDELIASLHGNPVNTGFKGKFKEVLVLYGEKLTLYLLGLGKKEQTGKMHQCFRTLAFNHGKNWEKGITLHLSHLNETVAEEAGTGIALASYRIGRYKTDDEAPAWLKKKFTVHIPDMDTSLFTRGLEIGNTLCSIMALIDAPANKKPPEVLGKWAVDSAKKYGYQTKVLPQKTLEKEGLHALLSVGRGSTYPPVLIISHYKPRKKTKGLPVIGLVGKGITFDTGGLSIKGSQNLHYMKSDMGGAAAVLGAVELAARLSLPVEVVGIVASAENAVDANSYRPGDVIDSYSGKTIEIIDTDAEGRLVLADALAYMQKNISPDYMIDLATLTGNSVMALGYAAGALFSNDDSLAKLLESSGEQVHERVWRMPLYDDFDSDLESDVADVRNFSGKPLAGAITAAKFLEFFAKDHPRWAHLDIAGVSFGDSEYSKMKSASGFGPRLLLRVMEQLAEES